MNNKIRKKLNSSGKAQCEMCKESHFLEEHHIHGRNIADFDLPWNKCQICPNCHTDVHNGIKVIEGWYMGTSGLELIWHHYKDESVTGKDAKPHLQRKQK